MKIETERLIIREWKEGDIKSLIENIDNLNIAKYLIAIPHPYTKKDAKWWISHCKEKLNKKPRKDYSLAIELKSEKRAIGGIGLSKVDKFQGTAQVGYWLGEKYHKRGLMSEALFEVLEFAFVKLNLRRIEAKVFVKNNASSALLIKSGFTHEGTLRKASIVKSTKEIRDDLIYGLLKEDWEKTKYARK
ncbi:MAG: GNAT family protein [Nanoarchaeota archaeon]